jgi:uncharacterized membrane protein YeaQ/YmgE (transglycosylase-associated protein family)
MDVFGNPPRLFRALAAGLGAAMMGAMIGAAFPDFMGFARTLLVCCVVGAGVGVWAYRVERG